MSSLEIPEVIFLTEKKDEDQILAEMKNQVISQWLYTIDVWNPKTKQTEKLTSLSYAGVKEAVRRRGNFRFVPCKCCGKTVHVDNDEKEYRVQVTVHDENRNIMFIGAAQSPKNTPFAWVLAVNKAERNAFRKMLPEKQIAVLVQQYLKDSSTISQPTPSSGKLG